jgi:hypothetical protein
MKTILALAFFAASVGGCTAGYSHTDISQTGTSELPASVSQIGVKVTHGDVLTAHVAPFNSDEKPMVGDVVSDDQTILNVVRAYGDKNYAFLGVKPGRTVVELKADGLTVARLEAEVLAQPAP